MSGPTDLSTAELKRILEWGIEDYACTKARVEALIKEVLRERERADGAEQKFYKMMSDLEIRRAQQGGTQNNPRYSDGIRYASDTPRPLGPDGFPQRGII